MPGPVPVVRRQKIGTVTHPLSIGSLLAVFFLCLPSLLGGSALLANAVLYDGIDNWQPNLSALVALGVLVGAPLVSVAALVGAMVAFSRSVPTIIKSANLFLVALAMIATFALLIRFAK